MRLRKKERKKERKNEKLKMRFEGKNDRRISVRLQ